VGLGAVNFATARLLKHCHPCVSVRHRRTLPSLERAHSLVQSTMPPATPIITITVRLTHISYGLTENNSAFN
jgi:hypothetical protein